MLAPPRVAEQSAVRYREVTRSKLLSPSLYLKGDLAASDVSIWCQDLPTQHIRSLKEPGYLGRQPAWRDFAFDGDLLHLAAGVEQRQGRMLQINPRTVFEKDGHFR